MTLHFMSDKELSRVEILRDLTSGRQNPAGIKAQALAVIRERYADFGLTLAAEKLQEPPGIPIGRETLRMWMLDAGLWADRQKRRGRVYQPRYRREWSPTPADLISRVDSREG